MSRAGIPRHEFRIRVWVGISHHSWRKFPTVNCSFKQHKAQKDLLKIEQKLEVCVIEVITSDMNDFRTDKNSIGCLD